ncbi:MAG: VOC family protein [Zoogloea sp.]|uniref:VOC family protein n=1 Tax=Zoogloea sp. TaxID=49181 RepID=UPI003F302792
MQRKGFSLNHLGLHVHDLAAMKDFYTRVFRFTVTDEGPLPTPEGPVNIVFLSRDPQTHHQIALIQARPEHVAFNVINQISLLADSLETLLATYQQLIVQENRVARSISHGNALSFYFHDPEGNRLELFWNTPWYVTQPMVKDMNFNQAPEALLRDAEAHASSLPGFKPRAEWVAEMQARMDKDNEGA